MDFTQILVSVMLAAVPATVWGYIFYKKDPVYRPKAKETFLLGAAAVIPILLYKASWEYLPFANVFNYTNNFQTDLFAFTSHLYLPLGTLFAFMFVGVIEEYLKHLVVKHADHGFFKNVDDAIEFSIISALGFAFVENALYFYYIWEFQGTDVMMISFIFRAIFSTFAHILFSGIYGYYYGLAYFADPIWSEEVRKSRHPLVSFFHTLLHMKSNRVFAAEKVTEGLFYAIILHAVFNVLLEMNLTFFMVPFLVFGYSLLDYLFKRKENLQNYGLLHGEESQNHLHNLIWKGLKKHRTLKHA
jgi:RsiW-degrading membrane proteinase PrsW (M82 family)